MGDLLSRVTNRRSRRGGEGLTRDRRLLLCRNSVSFLFPFVFFRSSIIIIVGGRKGGRVIPVHIDFSLCWNY